jgi:hypothetical protein
VDWGSSGRRFKSCQPDTRKCALTGTGAGFRVSRSGRRIRELAKNFPGVGQRTWVLRSQRQMANLSLRELSAITEVSNVQPLSQ